MSKLSFLCSFWAFFSYSLLSCFAWRQVKGIHKNCTLITCARELPDYLYIAFVFINIRPIVLVTQKPWLHRDMTKLLFTGMMNLKTNKYFSVLLMVAEQLRALFLNHSIISPLCLVWDRAPLWPHVRQAKFCLTVCQVFFSRGFSRFRPTY